MKALSILRLTFTIVFLVTNLLGTTDGNHVVAVITGANDILKLGLTIKEVIDQFDPGVEVDADSERVSAILSKRIDSSTITIITNVFLQSKLVHIEKAVLNIHSSLIDLRLIFQATSSNESKEYKKLFVDRFDAHGVIKHLRFLPELLEYKIPGTTGPLLQLFTDQIRCNMTAYDEFIVYYFNLISDGIALQITHLQLTSPLTINKTMEGWINSYDSMKDIFDEQYSECVNRFDDYVAADIEAANHPQTLWRHNNERYTWKKNDVLFLPPYGTHQFLYVEHSTDLFQHKSDKNKFAIFSDKGDVKPNSSLETELKFIKSAIVNTADENAAMNVANAVKSRLQDQGYIIKNIVVFFDGPEFASDAIIIDQESPVIRVTLHGVTLSYCHASGVVCILDDIDFVGVFNGRQSVSGQMEVFAYVSSGSLDIVRKSSVAARNGILPLFWYILLSACVQMGIGF